ncbi:GNAT family N-acetyltransferase [Pelagibius sp.]|uniref:GNAT family N-acetyltransferase n=1 Tax=Pelagibius sp. TaxID=1931238 RepID=UPI003BAFF591
MQNPSPTTTAQDLYSRFDAELQSTISFRHLDPDSDLERFNRWQNSDRVAQFWDERGTLDEHRDYLMKLIRAPQVEPLIGCLDGDPFLYLEVYWAEQDRLAAYYTAAPADRGIHMLVGEERHRGPRKVRAWLSALCRHLFEESPATQRIVSEPRYDNLKMIDYLEKQGFEKIKEFDFPHKRAALMLLTRDAFFKGQA